MVLCSNCGSKNIKFLKSHASGSNHKADLSAVRSFVKPGFFVLELYKCIDCGEITEISKTI